MRHLLKHIVLGLALLVGAALPAQAPAQSAALSNVAKLRNIVTVTDPAHSGGAKCDGTTDDITAINAAVDTLVTAGGGTLVFPEGTCIVSTPIKLRSNIVYQGQGWSSIVKQKASTTAMGLFGEASPAASQSNVVIRDLQLDGNRANVSYDNDDANGNAIRLNQVSHSRFENLYIHDTVNNAISVYNASNDNIIARNRIEDIGKTGACPGACTWNGVFVEFGADRNLIVHNRFSSLRQNGVWIGARDAHNYDNRVEGNWINSATVDGIRVGADASTNVSNRPKIIGNYVFSSGDIGIRLYHAGGGQVNDATIVGNTVESNTNGGIYAQAGAVRTVVAGNISRSNGGYGVGSGGTDLLATGNILLSNATGQIDATGGTRTIDNFNQTFTQSTPYSVQQINTGTGFFASRGTGNNVDVVMDQSGTVQWTMRNEATTGLLTFLFGATNALTVQRAPADGNIGLIVYRNVGGSLTLQQVSMGSAGSGGAGYKLLRVPD